jgi:hypothetical protein
MNCEDTEYKDFTIYKNKVLQPQEAEVCIDSIDSQCISNISLKECINICNENKNCEYGEFIYRKKDGETMCAALDKDNITGNISYFLYDKDKVPVTDKKKDIVPESESSKDISDDYITYYFTKNEIQPNEGNMILRGDSFHLAIDIVDSNGKMVTKKVNEIVEDKPITVEDFGGVLEILGAIKPSISLNYGDFVSITNYITNKEEQDLRYKSTLIIENIDNKLIGDRHRNIKSTDNQLFFMFPLDQNDIDSPMTYYTRFYLKSKIGEGIIQVNEKGELVSTNKKLKDIENPVNILFYMIPKGKGYYCEEKQCIEVNLEDCEHKGPKAFYTNKNNEQVDVFRRKDCFGACECNEENKLSSNFLESKECNSTDNGVIKKTWPITLAVCLIFITILLVVYFVF